MKDLFLPDARAVELREHRSQEQAARARVARRHMFRLLGWGTVGAVAAQLCLGLLTFFRPRRLGSFGSTVKAGRIDDFQVGDVRSVPAGKFYVVRVPEGFIALWWKCPHLGCTVPWHPLGPVEDADRGFAERGHFKCPCHSSQYNRYGQITYGPAPRPMDRFPLRIDNGTIFVDTGPERAISRSVAGPSDATPA
jgi:cytochrome b6-f complex iron-sulfur subunit